MGPEGQKPEPTPEEQELARVRAAGAAAMAERDSARKEDLRARAEKSAVVPMSERADIGSGQVPAITPDMEDPEKADKPSQAPEA